MLHIPDVLTSEEAAQLRDRLVAAQWVDGNATSGAGAAEAEMHLPAHAAARPVAHGRKALRRAPAARQRLGDGVAARLPLPRGRIAKGAPAFEYAQRIAGHGGRRGDQRQDQAGKGATHRPGKAQAAPICNPRDDRHA